MITPLLIAALVQCPDGTPPPCAGARAPARAVTAAPDPSSRIVVLPFRVTTADSLLGEGVVELLAAEFTGEGGPSAVHMGTVIRAWRQAGGGARLPMPQPVAERTTRQLGAGTYVDGSIVGLGNRLTVTASVVALDGTTRRTPSIAGPLDSLPVLLQRLSAALLTASGTRRTGSVLRLSDSPAAIRLYMEGLAHFRHGDFQRAVASFEQAFAAGDQFARAAFMRWLTATWGPDLGTPVQDLWRERARTLRDHLSAQDQLVLDAALGNLAVRERIAAAMPESPEVWYFVGDSYYHGARTRGWAESMARARDAFQRSIALDTQVTSLQHLIEIGLWDTDTALLRETWPAFDRFTEGREPGLGVVVAARLGDVRLLDTMRRRLAAGTAGSFYLLAYGPPSGLPAALVDEAYALDHARVPRAAQGALRAFGASVAISQGRPGRAALLASQGYARDTLALRGFDPYVWLMVSAALGDGDRAVGETARARVLAERHADSTNLAVARCGLRLWDALVQGSVVADDPLFQIHQRPCGTTLRMLAEQRAGTLDSARLRVLDSTVIAQGAVLWPYSGVGPWLSGRAWEALGVRSRALARVRTASVGFADFMMAARRRAEGRLAAATGDTTGAIRVYREYLDLRRDAEPVLIPQRDSVQAELDRLLGRGRPVP